MSRPRTLSVFNTVSLDGFFVDGDGDMSFAHADNDAELAAFTAENASGGGALLFGRVTYEMMASFWPTPAAAQQMPAVAAAMNAMPKYVASRTLRTPRWQNTTALNDVVAGARALKAEAGPDIVVLGSGSVVAALVAAGVVDELRLMVAPRVLGRGRSLFAGAPPSQWALTSSRAFPCGKLHLRYTRR